MQQEFIAIGQSRAFSFQASSGTGYTWMLATLSPGAWLESVQTSSAAHPGAPITTTFVITGASEGLGALRFVLARPWQPHSIAGEHTYQLRVGTSSPVMPLYAAALQQAKNSGDVARMRSLATLAQQQLGSSGEISSALADVQRELASRGGGPIAQHEQRGSFPVPPYGVAIHEAIASGDPATMRRAETSAVNHLSDVQQALGALRGELARSAGGGPVIPLYGVSLQQALASGDLARMRSVVNQAETTANLPADAQSALAEVKAYLGQLKN
jgi:hypothetical protein